MRSLPEIRNPNQEQPWNFGGGQTPFHIAYVFRRYPRFSETFVVREILAHEVAGATISIFSLRYPNDTHFQDSIAEVRAPVTYLRPGDFSGAELWQTMESVAEFFPHFWQRLENLKGEDPENIYQAIQLAGEVAERGIDHIHAPFASLPATIARLASKLTEIPYTITARAKDIFHQNVSQDDLRKKLRDAAAIITVSDYHLRYLKQVYEQFSSRIFRVYNCLDLPRFPFHEPMARPPKILGVGRLVEKKGFRYLIDACAILRDRGIPFMCEIIGKGLLENELRDQIRQLDLESKVYLLGPLPESEVREQIQRVAVFALPCIIGSDQDMDGLPNVLFESMALGTPCISTDVAGIPEILTHEKTGLMVPQCDASSLADAIQRLLNDRSLGVKLARQARALIEANFDSHRNAAQRRAIFSAFSRETELTV